MNTIKLLHCADIHIGAAESFLEETAEKRRYETLLTFEKIVDTAVENGVQLLAVAGDLFDSNNIETALYKPVFEKIASAAPIKVVFAAGNHDPLNSSSPFMKMKLPENLYVLGTEDTVYTFDDIKLRVYGRSFDSAYLLGEERFSLEIPDDDYVNICVQHGELSGDTSSLYNAVTKEFIASTKADYIALGHIHKATDTGNIGNTYFAYCGCPEGQGFDELDEKGVYIGEVGKGVCRLEFVPTAKRKHIKQSVDITGCADTDAVFCAVTAKLTETAGMFFSENLYKIELTGTVPGDAEIDTAALSARLNERIFYAKITDRTKKDIPLESIAKEPTLKGIFVKNMLGKIASSDGEEREAFRYALEIGLDAFDTEVKFDEDK